LTFIETKYRDRLKELIKEQFCFMF